MNKALIFLALVYLITLGVFVTDTRKMIKQIHDDYEGVKCEVTK